MKEEVYKEDRFCYFIPFHQLFTGYGWGSNPQNSFQWGGIEVLEGGRVKSQKKFAYTGKVTYYTPGESITLGELFEAVDGARISNTSTFAFVSPKNEGDTVSATYTKGTGDDWTTGTITFSQDSHGPAKIVISDYYYCTETVIYLNADIEAFTIDFKADAALMAEAEWWSKIQETSIDGVKIIGNENDKAEPTGATSAAVITEIDTWMKEHLSWYITNIQDPANGFDNKWGFHRLAINSNNDENTNFGLMLRPINYYSGYGKDSLELTITAPATGEYYMNVESFYGQGAKYPTMADDPFQWRTGNFADVYVNGEKIQENYLFGFDKDTTQTPREVISQLGAVSLKEGPNTIVFDMVRNGYTNTDGTQTYTFPISSIEFNPACQHVASEVSYTANGDGTHSITNVCGCGEVSNTEENVPCTAGADGTCVCGNVINLVLDFVQVAKEISQESDIWSGLVDTNVEGVKATNGVNAGAATSTQIAAAKKLGTWLDQNTCWNIPDLYAHDNNSSNPIYSSGGGAGHYMYTNSNKSIAFDPAGTFYGLHFFTGTENRYQSHLNSAWSKLALIVDAPKAGDYRLTVDAFLMSSANTTTIPSPSGAAGDHPGAVTKLYINRDITNESRVSTATSVMDCNYGNSSKPGVTTIDYGTVTLKEGTNYIELVVYGSMNGHTSLNLRNMIFYAADSCTHEYEDVVAVSDGEGFHTVTETCLGCGIVNTYPEKCFDTNNDGLCDDGCGYDGCFHKSLTVASYELRENGVEHTIKYVCGACDEQIVRIADCTDADEDDLCDVCTPKATEGTEEETGEVTE